MKKRVLSCVAVAGLCAATANAGLVTNPWAPDGGGGSAEKNLYEVLGMTLGQENSLQGAEELWTAAVGSEYSSLLVEFAGSKNVNEFGIYDPDNLSSKLPIFLGTDSSPAAQTLSITYNAILDKFTLTVGLNSITLGTGKTDYGFYLTNPGISSPPNPATFYSESGENDFGSSLNEDHLATYDIDDTKFGKPPFPSNDGWVLAWEDLKFQAGDEDYNDMVVTFTAQPIPEPTTVIAGGLLLLPFAASTIRFVRRNRQRL